MNRIVQYNILALAMVVLSVSCGGTKSNNAGDQVAERSAAVEKVVPAALYEYRVVAEYPHSVESYTQGLQYVDGVMWEGTGQEGRSQLQRVDLKSGKIDIVAKLSDKEFGEGITHYKDKIYQLTWLTHIAHVYNADGELVNSIKYRGEGWGITTDGQELYMSDGTSTIRRVDPETFKTLESICVTLDGAPLDLINELEWIDGHIWANIYLTDAIVEIDPKTGVVVGYVDLPELRLGLKDNPEAEVLNGVAYNPANGHLFVTGKQWNKLFEIEIIK